MKRKHFPLAGLMALLVTLFVWAACKKADPGAAPLSEREQMAVETTPGSPGNPNTPVPADTVSPNPIYNITDSCGVTCEMGSCSRKVTYDARYCKLKCKCGGIGSLWPECSLDCKFPTQVPGGTTGLERQYVPQVEITIQANDRQLQAQANFIAGMKVSSHRNAAKIVAEIQAIHNLFKSNNGKLTGVNADRYTYHLARSVSFNNAK